MRRNRIFIYSSRLFDAASLSLTVQGGIIKMEKECDFSYSGWQGVSLMIIFGSEDDSGGG